MPFLLPWIKEGEKQKCFRYAFTKKRVGESKMGKFIKVKGQFSPWELALLVGLYIIHSNSIQLIV